MLTEEASKVVMEGVHSKNVTAKSTLKHETTSQNSSNELEKAENINATSNAANGCLEGGK